MYNYFKKKFFTILTLIIFVIIGFMCKLTGCGMIDNTENEKLQVVATTTMIYDLVSNIGGENINIVGLMNSGVDPHLYQASARDVIKMQEADLVVYNGLHLEGKMGDVFASLSSQNKNVICLEDGIDKSYLIPNEKNPEIYDPHIWFDVNIWMMSAEYVTLKLCEYDIENSESYKANLDEYIIELENLDNYIKNRIKELPNESRYLITAHDAFRYFGNAYGIEVRGLQGISTESEAGTSDLSLLADFIAQNKIKAIFIESSLSPKSVNALKDAVNSRGGDVNIGGELYSDSLGDKKSGNNSYILTCKSNIDIIINAMK